MSDKGKQKQDKTSKDSLEEVNPPPRHMSAERHLAALEQAIEEHGFKSADEINKFLEDMRASGGSLELVPKTPLDKAQEMIYEAWETPSRRQRVKLARKALKICPVCADAYLVLAEDAARNIEEACELYRLGVKAGEQALGVETFSKLVGQFWGFLGTRPYMRARAGLADCLYQMGRYEEAVEHYWAMLRLNPNDNQGIRYLLAACLLVDLGNTESLLKLLQQYKGDITAVWYYTWALVTFIYQGDSAKARRRLKSALKQNPHVVPYLLFEKRLPKELPDYIGIGDETEAASYYADFGAAWHKTEGAIAWLELVLSEKQRKRQSDANLSGIPEVFLKAFEDGKQPGMDRTSSQNKKENAARIYTFKVSLKDTPRIWRKIEIKGDQTLHQLHKAIFEAFDRFDEHLYAFFLSNKPWDRSTEYGLADPESEAKNAKRAKIGSLGLQEKKSFLYLFDFGDEWWHSIKLLSVGEEEVAGKYPCIVESKGEAPPQYPPCEEE
jgi:Plasmid pRiA4b ORF-3-like protein./ST7 protein.